MERHPGNGISLPGCQGLRPLRTESKVKRVLRAHWVLLLDRHEQQRACSICQDSAFHSSCPTLCSQGWAWSSVPSWHPVSPFKGFPTEPQLLGPRGSSPESSPGLADGFSKDFSGTLDEVRELFEMDPILSLHIYLSGFFNQNSDLEM